MTKTALQFKAVAEKYSPTAPDVEFSKYFRRQTIEKKPIEELIDDTIYMLGGIEGIPAKASEPLRDKILKRIEVIEHINKNYKTNLFDLKVYHFPGQNNKTTIDNVLEIEIKHEPEWDIMQASFYQFSDSALYIKLRKAILDLQP